MTITTPYTFVPFGPTITAGELWRDDTPTVDPTRAFDRPVPGLHTGCIDLTLTSLSGLYLGDHAATGHSLRWPTAPHRFAIPGSSLRGMLRAHIAALTGAALGLGPRDDLTPTLRHPVGVRLGSNPNVAARNQYRAHTAYTARRSSPTARPGRQRVGMLVLENGKLGVREAPQFQLPIDGRPLKMPSVRWPVVVADLFTGVTGDPREHLQAKRGQIVWVVWAQILVNNVSRPVAVAVGDTSDAAITNTRARVGSATFAADLRPNTAPGRPPQSITFAHFVNADWGPTSNPVPREMVLLPTNLANLDEHGHPRLGAGSPAANCYLVANPTKTFTSSHRPDPRPIPVQLEAIKELMHLLNNPRAQQPWVAPPYNALKDRQVWPTRGAPRCFPVFFDTGDDGTVTHLGTSNGFAVLAKHTLQDTVRRAGGRWTRTLHDKPADNDAVDALFGALHQNRQIRSRIAVGHATATTDLTALPSHRADLFGPHLQSAATRLDNPTRGTDPVSYDDDNPTYRGRQFYWHRGSWAGDGADTWAQHAHQHQQLWGADPDAAAQDRAPLAPLPVGASFCARITFTNLTTAELGLLLFALTFAGHTGQGSPVFAHKVGGGKPLGLGSVTISSRVTLRTADRYLRPGAPEPRPEVDAAPFLAAFCAAAGWDSDNAAPDWVTVADTGRAWPRHVAAWLLVHQWRRRPHPDATRECPVADFASLTPSRDVFDLAGVARR